MCEKRLVTELYFEKQDFADVSKAARLLGKSGVNALMMPPDDRGINTHLVVENEDLPRARETLRRLGLATTEKEVVLAKLENRPGSMAAATGKMAAAGVNLLYAFSLTMDEKSYTLFGTSDNKKALEVID
jgi:hypothetical protein